MHPMYPITEKEFAHAQQALDKLTFASRARERLSKSFAMDGHDATQAKAILDILLETQENCESALRLLRAFRL